MLVIDPENLSDSCNHGNNGCGIDIAELKGDKEENDGE